MAVIKGKKIMVIKAVGNENEKGVNRNTCKWFCATI